MQRTTFFGSCITVRIDDNLYGDLSKGDKITVLYELSSYDCGDTGLLLKEGESYYFFLSSVEKIMEQLKENFVDYKVMGDYFCTIAPPDIIDPSMRLKSLLSDNVEMKMEEAINKFLWRISK